MNRTGKVTAKKGPYDEYNAFKEFFDRETEAHIIAAWMEFSGMQKIDDAPTKRPVPGCSEWSKIQKRTWFHNEIADFLDQYLFGETAETVTRLNQGLANMEHERMAGYKCRVAECNETFLLHPMRVKHEISQHNYISPDLILSDERDDVGYYKCRGANCFLIYKTKASRNRHERKTHQELQIESSDANEQLSEETTDDHKYNYHAARLFYGLLMENTHDSIREGDATRLFHCTKFSLLLFRKFRKDKYAYTTLLFLCKVFAILSEREANQLLRNRFFNGKGRKGKNIPLDLMMEFFNHTLKSCLRMLGGNINERNAQRVARSLCLMKRTLDSIDCDISKVDKSGNHNLIASVESVSQIVADLVDGKVFTHQPGRKGYTTFPSFHRDILKGLDYRDFFAWSRDLLNTWEAMYE